MILCCYPLILMMMVKRRSYKGVGTMRPQALMKVINAVVLIEDLGTSHVEVAGQFCIVLITNNHVFKTANAAKSSRIKFEGHNDFIGLRTLTKLVKK